MISDVRSCHIYATDPVNGSVKNFHFYHQLLCFIDIIHTAGRWVGNSDLSGHVDFYPNHGLAPQPGCEGRESLDLSCSHRKAWQIYMESIQTKKNLFFAVKCPSSEAFALGHCCHSHALLNLALMGESAHNTTRGTYYLYTNTDNPYAKKKSESINCSFKN